MFVWQATNEVIGKVPVTTEKEMKQAAESAQEAFKAWRNTPVTARARKMFEYRDRIVKNLDRIAANISQESGKTPADARGDVIRGLGSLTFK